MFVDFVPWAIGENLLFSPTGDRAKVITLDKVLKGLVVGPLAGDEIGSVVADILPEGREGMTLRGVKGLDDGREFFFKSGLFARQRVVIHPDGDHGGFSLRKLAMIMQQITPAGGTRQATRETDPRNGKS